MISTKKLSKGIALGLASLFLLTACGKGSESPETVIEKFKEKTTKNETVDATLSMNFSGQDQVDTMNLDVEAVFKVDQTDETNQKMATDLSLDAIVNTGDARSEGTVELSFLIANANVFFNLKEFDFNDPGIETFQPTIEAYTNQWFQLANEFLPTSLKNLQAEATPERLEKQEEMKELFRESDWIKVSKEYGTEEVNGHETYHYQVMIDEKGLMTFLNEIAQIEEEEAPLAVQPGELDELIRAIESVDLWIGTDDYLLYKAVGNFHAENEELEGTVFDFSVTYQAKQYDGPVQIDVPTEFETFDPLGFMLGLSSQPTELESDETVSE